MSERKYPDLFYRFAFSGQAKCHGCMNIIKQGQFVFVFKGNVFHDACSQDLKGREKLEEAAGSVLQDLLMEDFKKRANSTNIIVEIHGTTGNGMARG